MGVITPIYRNEAYDKENENEKCEKNTDNGDCGDCFGSVRGGVGGIARADCSLAIR